MSHGHDHKKYKAVFGDVEKHSRGLTVLCDGDAPKTGTETKQQNRAVCLGRPMRACKTCEHSTFSIRLKPRLGDQLVACPRWASSGDRVEHVPPQYEMVRREQCLLRRPYEHCAFCPNKDVHSRAETEPGWWERTKWKED